MMIEQIIKRVKQNVKKQYTYEDIISYNYSLRARGISSYNVKSLFRSACGVGCVVVGVVTSFIPFTSIPLYIVGGGLLGVDIVKLYYKIKGFVGYELHLRVLTASARLKARLNELRDSLYLFIERRFKKKW